MTSHRERVRPVKERVGSSARDGDGEGGTNDVYASRILGSRCDFRTLQLMCYKLRKHEDSTGEISVQKSCKGQRGRL